jgi:hypothetical protein
VRALRGLLGRADLDHPRVGFVLDAQIHLEAAFASDAEVEPILVGLGGDVEDDVAARAAHPVARLVLGGLERGDGRALEGPDVVRTCHALWGACQIQ